MSDTFHDFVQSPLRAYVGKRDEDAWRNVLEQLASVRDAARKAEAGLPDLERNLRAARGDDANSWYHRQREHMGRFLVGMLEAQVRWNLEASDLMLGDDGT